MASYGSALAIQTFVLLLAYWQQNWSLALGGFILGLSALMFPPWARLIERSWQRIGFTLARVVNPVTLMILFLFIIVPFAILARTFRWLNPAFNKQADSQLVVIHNCPTQKSFSKPF